MFIVVSYCYIVGRVEIKERENVIISNTIYKYAYIDWQYGQKNTLMFFFSFFCWCLRFVCMDSPPDDMFCVQFSYYGYFLFCNSSSQRWIRGVKAIWLQNETCLNYVKYVLAKISL